MAKTLSEARRDLAKALKSTGLNLHTDVVGSSVVITMDAEAAALFTARLEHLISEKERA